MQTLAKMHCTYKRPYTWHLVDKLTKQPHIGKIAHYQQCLPHFVKPNWINQYVKGEQITTTKDGAKSFSNKIKDYLAIGQMVFYVKNSGHLS